MSNAVVHYTVCPHCGYRCDRASEVRDEGVRPKDGDVSMCFTCGKWSVFEAKLARGLRKPDALEKMEIARDPDCFRAHWAWQTVMAGRKLH